MAQRINMAFDRITVEQGLTSNRINGIIQDKSGFLWVATNNGLNRFDGINNKQYTKQVGDSTSLSTNTILSQYCSSKGQLWFLTVNYLHRYNQKFDNFDRFLLSNKKESTRYGNKGMIAEDAKGNIWIGTPTNGLFVFNQATSKCERILPQINAVSSLFFDHDGLLWIGGEFGLLLNYNPETKLFKKFKVNEELRRNLSEDFIWNIWQDKPGRMNLLLSSGLFQFDPQKEKFSELTEWNKKVNYSNNSLRSVLVEKNALWIGTQGGGMYYLDLVSDKVSQYQSVYSNLGSLSNNSITAILQDNLGVYWIGTNDGINKYDPNMQLFAHYQKDPGNPNSLQYNFVSSFCESPDGTIWIGTFGQGISVFDRSLNTFHTIAVTPGAASSLIHNTIRAIEPDKSGNIWVGTTNGLSCYKLGQKKFVNYKKINEKGSISSDNILSLLVTRNNQLFIGSNGEGLSFCNVDRISQEGFKQYHPEIEYINAAKVRKMIELGNGSIVLGSLGNGITILTGENSVNILPSAFSKSIDSDYVNALCEDKDHNIWIGTWDGMFLMDSDSKILKQFNPQNGLASNEISGILADSKGDIWAVGMNGLSHLSKTAGTEYKITNYTSRNGLQGSYFTTYSSLRTSDGEMYFGGYNGFNRFYPESIKSSQKAPEVKITDFQVFNRSVKINQRVNGRIILTQNILDTKSIILNDQHRVIGFGYTALTTSQNEKIKFACRMEGVDPEWVIQDYNQRYISYNNLDPGDYTFTVKACNADGVWNETGTSISIRVLPPFWKTWWAYGFYFIFIAGLLYLAREYSLSRERLENKALLERIHREKDAEINNLKIKFFINISHEIRTPLSLIVSPLEKLLHSESLNLDFKKHLNIMYGNAQRLLTLVNQLLDFRKIETGNVHLHVSRYDIVSFANEIKQAFADSAVQKNIQISIKSNVRNLQLWFDADSMEKILYNLLSNAIKFTPVGGSVQILVNHLSSENKCEIIVRDNGIGVPAEKLGKLFDRFYQVDTKSFLKQDSVGSGIGLSIVKSLVELHKGEISVESKEGEYTQFKIVFATGKKHLENNDSVTLSEESLTHSFNLRSVAPMADMENQDIADFEFGHKKKKEVKILIVEDNPEISYYLKESLKSDYEILIAPNGKAGCDLARLNIPDLIITDVMMPEMDGIELCRSLKTEQLTQHIPIIILSAKSSIEDMLEGLETGADDYIPKPFNEQILKAKIRTLLSNRQNLIRKFQLQASDSKPEEESDLPGFDDPFIGKIIEYIHENLTDEGLNNEKIEAHFRISKMQLYRKLKAVTGLSINTLIRDIRILEAKKLLQKQEMNISEIAYRLGFSDPLYFSKYFKKEVGVAPIHYRKEK